MRLLFIKLKHIGDLLLLTPTLAGIKEAHPEATIWVVARKGTESILAGCPHIDRVLTGPEPEVERRGKGQARRTWDLIRELRRQHFDHVFELGDHDRGRFLAVASGARKRTTAGRNPKLSNVWRLLFDHLPDFEWQLTHRVEKDWLTAAAALPALRGVEPGPLVFAEAARERWSGTPEEKYAVIHPATRWPEKEWVPERWVEIGRGFAARGWRVVVSCGPAEHEIATARTLTAGIGPAALSTEGQLSWTQLAGLLGGAQIFAGVDTAAMHLAAACGVPTVGLFGPSIEWQWHPWKCPHRVCALPLARPDESDPLRRVALAEQRKTKDISLTEVQQACDALLAAPTLPA